MSKVNKDYLRYLNMNNVSEDYEYEDVSLEENNYNTEQIEETRKRKQFSLKNNITKLYNLAYKKTNKGSFEGLDLAIVNADTESSYRKVFKHIINRVKIDKQKAVNNNKKITPSKRVKAEELQEDLLLFAKTNTGFNPITLTKNVI